MHPTPAPLFPPEPVDPAFSRRLVDDDYFKHLLRQQLSQEFAATVRPELEKATKQYWSTRWKQVAGVFGTILFAASVLGYSSWNQIRLEAQEQVREAQARLKEANTHLAEIGKTRSNIQDAFKDVRSLAENAARDQLLVKASLADARNVVNDYLSHGQTLLDSSDKLSEKTFTMLQTSLSKAANDTDRLQVLSDRLKSSAEAAEKLQATSAQELAARTTRLNQELAQVEEKRRLLETDLQRVGALRQFAASSASEVFALRAHPPHNAVTIRLPDLDDPAKSYELTFNSTGLAPPVSIAVTVKHPDAEKRFSGAIPIRAVKEPCRIASLPLVVEMDFLYHTKVAPDFAILRVRYDPEAIRPASLQARGTAAARP